MNDGAWERLIDSIDATVGFDAHRKTKRPLEDRPELTESVEEFEFERGGVRFKLERVSGPAVVDRKSHYSHRGGTASRIENIYDASDIAHRETLYREIGGDWQEQDISALAG